MNGTFVAAIAACGAVGIGAQTPAPNPGMPKMEMQMQMEMAKMQKDPHHQLMMVRLAPDPFASHFVAVNQRIFSNAVLILAVTPFRSPDGGILSVNLRSDGTIIY